MEPGNKIPADARLLDTSTLQVDESALTGESVPADKNTAPVPAASGIGDRSNTVFSGTHVVAGDATAVAGVMLLVGWLIHQRESAQLVPATIAFAVAAIPEGLPALVTITLALGVRQMASHNAIVRKLAAVETLGSVTTICTDKTGTLTRNKMTVRTVITGAGTYAIAGTGYAPTGMITATAAGDAASRPDLTAVVEVFELCSHELGPDGAPRPIDRAKWTQAVAELSDKGLRVLAGARSGLTAPTKSLLSDELATGMVFLGVAGILDPPRAEAVAAIATMHRAGIRVKMITGDHPGTALAIAREMRIARTDSPVLTGDAIERMDDQELAAQAPDVDVYARTSPEHKLRIVAVLQSHGDVVAMTGDGVNDAPALRRADIGVAMGIKGTETTKEAADNVLADDNFATIGHAVVEGRRIRDNLQKSLLFLLPTTSAQALVLLLAVLFGFTLPLQATQILWVNLITAITLSLALATEPADPGSMDRPPLAPGRGILDRTYVARIVWVTTLITAATLGVFFFELHSGTGTAVAQTTAVTMLTLGQLAFLFNCRFLEASSLRPAALRGNRAIYISSAVLLVLQLIFVYAPFMYPWFHSAPIGIREWGYTTAVAVLIFILTEASKMLERFGARRRAGGDASSRTTPASPSPASRS